MADDRPDGDLVYKDAVFLSPHKFIGGPGTPGVLIAKRHLFKNTVPAEPGGGTVAYVNTVDHRYLANPEHREEGGTPAIIESIRAGLVFQLKQAVGHDVIRAREETFIKRAIESWSKNPNIVILGNQDAWRLSIVSFVVRHNGDYLHHNFAVALLNDLFGIQARGGCSCAGPYGHRLLGIDLATSKEFEREIVRGCEGIKPGWVRVNFNYFLSEAQFQFLLEAIHLVANEGWKLLPQYRFEPLSGLWHHHGHRPVAAMRLAEISYNAGKMEYRSRHATEPESALAGYLDEARKVFAAAASCCDRACDPTLTEDFEELRWFLLPGEARAELQDGQVPTRRSSGSLRPH